MHLDIPHLLVVFGTVLSVFLAVTLHYEVFIRISDLLERRRKHGRPRILAMVFALIIVHGIEIWLFSVAAFLLSGVEGAGGIHAPYVPAFFDYVYLSATTFTTVGYGDLAPYGAIRFLYGTEALAGFALITWSASLTFLEMQRHWQEGRHRS